MNKATMRIDEAPTTMQENNNNIKLEESNIKYTIPERLSTITDDKVKSEISNNICYVGNKYYANVYDHNLKRVTYIRKETEIDFTEPLNEEEKYPNKLIYCRLASNGEMVPIKTDEDRIKFCRDWLFTNIPSKAKIETGDNIETSNRKHSYGGIKDIPSTHNQLRKYHIYFYTRYLVEEFTIDLIKEICEIEDIRVIYDPIARVLFSSRVIKSIKDKKCVIAEDLDYPKSSFIELEDFKKFL